MVRIGQRELQALNIDTNITQLPATSSTQPSGTRVTMSTAGNSTTNRNPSQVLQPGHLETSLVYILETVFGYSAGSILHLALDLYGCKCYLNLVGLDDADIDGLQYPGLQRIHRVLQPHHPTASCLQAICLPAEEFDRGINLDANLYPTLSNNRQWDSPHGKRLTSEEEYPQYPSLAEPFVPDLESVDLGPEGKYGTLDKENFQYHRLVEPFVTDLASVDLEPDPVVDLKTKRGRGTLDLSSVDLEPDPTVDPDTKSRHGTLDDNHVQYPCLVESVATDLASVDLEPNPLAYRACLASLATLPCKKSLCTAKLEAAGSNNQPPAQPPPSPQHPVNLHEMSTTTDFLSQFQHSSMGRSEDADTLTSVTSEETKSDKLALVPATKYRKATQEVKNYEISIDGVDVDEWAKSVPDDGSAGERSPFDRVDILTKRNTTVTTLKDSPALDDAIGFFETHHCVMPTNGLYKLHPGQASDLDWLECNMAGLFDLDPAHVPQLRPPDFKAYKSGRQPSVLFVHETPINFVIESTPLRDQPIDLTYKLSPSGPRRSPRCKTHSEDGRWNSKDKSAEPGPLSHDPNAHDPVLTMEPMYNNLSSAMKSHERNWERLCTYFEWLPKLDIQKLFLWTIVYLARSPVEAHHEHKYHLLASSLESICYMLGTVGNVEHPGCHMTYQFLFLERNNFLFPSEICSARSPTKLHKH
ncbi:unnamed protein product [Cylindrotheca closterium]|uniref:Uncharacterized protein n=1 Tax=Cylindrotheca closterium TaxID=2856 RepID=A0AAD2CRL6_9STRA|nr:unnamed protein product [Cylindrotheca closterium]